MRLVDSRLMEPLDGAKKRIEALLAAIDCTPPRKQYDRNSSSAERTQVRTSLYLLRRLEYEIPDDLRSIYEGIQALLLERPVVPYDKALRGLKARTDTTVRALAWMSDNYNSKECRWLLAAAHLKTAINRPEYLIDIRDYHGSYDGIIMVDREIKGISDFYPYLHRRVVYTRDTLCFRYSNYDEDDDFEDMY